MIRGGRGHKWGQGAVEVRRRGAGLEAPLLIQEGPTRERRGWLLQENGFKEKGATEKLSRGTVPRMRSWGTVPGMRSWGTVPGMRRACGQSRMCYDAPIASRFSAPGVQRELNICPRLHGAQGGTSGDSSASAGNYQTSCVDAIVPATSRQAMDGTTGPD
jgi:hypothetical protein